MWQQCRHSSYLVTSCLSLLLVIFGSQKIVTSSLFSKADTNYVHYRCPGIRHSILHPLFKNKCFLLFYFQRTSLCCSIPPPLHVPVWGLPCKDWHSSKTGSPVIHFCSTWPNFWPLIWWGVIFNSLCWLLLQTGQCPGLISVTWSVSPASLGIFWSFDSIKWIIRYHVRDKLGVSLSVLYWMSLDGQQNVSLLTFIPIDLAPSHNTSCTATVIASRCFSVDTHNTNKKTPLFLNHAFD